MASKNAPLLDSDISYVRRWTERYDVGERFKFLGWKDFHKDDRGAPEATTIGDLVVAALEGASADPRLDFIGLAQGRGKHGKIGDKSSGNAQYYKRLK